MRIHLDISSGTMLKPLDPDLRVLRVNYRINGKRWGCHFSSRFSLSLGFSFPFSSSLSLWPSASSSPLDWITDVQYPFSLPHFEQDMTLNEASLLALRTLKQVMEEKLDEHNVQLAVVTPKVSKDGRPSGQFKILEESELKGLVEVMWNGNTYEMLENLETKWRSKREPLYKCEKVWDHNSNVQRLKRILESSERLSVELFACKKFRIRESGSKESPNLLVLLTIEPVPLSFFLGINSFRFNWSDW